MERETRVERMRERDRNIEMGTKRKGECVKRPLGRYWVKGVGCRNFYLNGKNTIKSF